MKNKDSKNNKSLIFTRETLGMTLLLFSAIVLLALFSGSTIFAGFGAAICTFMYGTFGYGCYFVVALLAYLGEWLTFEKTIKLKVRPAIWCAVTVLCLFLLFHTVTTRSFTFDSSYIAACYTSAEAGWSGYTFGGVISALFVYPVVAVTKLIGAYIIFSLLTVFFAYLSVMSVRKYYFINKKRENEEEDVQNNAVVSSAEAAADFPSQNFNEVPCDNGQSANNGIYGQPVYGNNAYGGQPVYGEQYSNVNQSYGQQNINSGQPYAQQNLNDGQPYVQQPYVDQPYAQPYDYVSPAQQVFGNPQPEVEPPEIDYKKDGRKILFENGEFDPESYRRNGIFDESSYFNHPVHNDGDYLKVFSDGKKSSGTNILPTYSQSQAQNVEQQDMSIPGNVLYGDEPVDDLGDFTKASTGEYSAQPEQSYKPSEYTEKSNPYEINPFSEDDIAEEHSEYLGPDDRTYENIQPAEPAPTDDYISFGGSEERIDRFPQGRSIQPPDEHSDLSSGFTESRRNTGFTDDILPEGGRSTGFNDNIMPEGRRGDGLADGIMPEDRPLDRSVGFNDRTRSNPLDIPGPDDNQSTGTGRDSLYNLFGSGNSRLSENKSEDDNDNLFSIGRDSSRADLFGGERHDFDSNAEDTPDAIDPGRRDRSNAGIFDDVSENDDDMEVPSERGRDLFAERPSPLARTPEQEQPPVTCNPEPVVPPVTRNLEPVVPPVTRNTVHPPVESKPEPTPPPPPHVWKKYVRPSLDLLDDYPEYGNVDTAEIEENKNIIMETLGNFRIESRISEVVVGPAITRYDVIILDKTNIKKSLQYKDSIAMALKKDNLNAYLNYAKGALSIEVPNTKRAVVGLKSMLMTPAYMNSKPNSLTFTLGKNVEGMPVCPDITKMPHLLVAGTTGSGKSICLSVLLISLLYKYGPEELRLILVDPKQVEFISYDKLPHLMINEIIYDVDKAIKALNWAVKEMERRYSLFKDMTESGINAKGGAKTATKNLDEYNSHLEEGLEKLPKIVIILDEFGDLMLQAKKDIESRIIKLVQKARAAGIHLILATQRPSVDCITGLIKSNLPTRMGFKVGSTNDSQVIFDKGGAEKLLGKGDMYFRSPDSPDLIRIQCCFVDTHEVQKVTDFIKANNETYFDQSISDFINKVEEPETTASLSESGGMDSDEAKIDEVYLRALRYCVDNNKASVSMLQRRFPIGYMKACKIIDWMENMNYITKGEGANNSRKILLSLDEFINTYGDIDV